MRASRRYSIILAIIMIFVVVFLSPNCYGNSEPAMEQISDWHFKWEYGQNQATVDSAEVVSEGGWASYRVKQPLPPQNQQTRTAWIQMKLPSLEWNTPAVLMEPVYGQHIVVYLDDQKIYELSRDYMYDTNKILLPLSQEDAGRSLLIRIEAEKDRIGIQEPVLIGDYQTLLKHYVRANIEDVILGSFLVFIALVMIISALFLKKTQLVSWLTLALVILSIGALILTYSPFLYNLFENSGQFFLTVFDIALFTLLPSLTFYFEETVGIGYMLAVRIYRKLQVGYSIFCLGFMIINQLFHDRFFETYYFFSVKILGCLMIIQLVMLVISAIQYAVKGNKEAIVFAAGFAVFALISLTEMIWFFVQKGDYALFWWKWGVLGFIISLIVILGRKFALNHQQIVVYSRELEMFNRELQRSEKMEIISELAASVAHEVRNPLQVTRGFLQLLQEKSREREKEYLRLALEELDRASSIITDFLTFAKPEAEQISLMDISDEFRHIEGILIPLANFQGGGITSDIPDHLYVQGNSSKFKQAFINIIKNSIEALHGEGLIQIWAYLENSNIVIHIQDNGEGMDSHELARLGEPYFSNKTKGTGLGLMVTFRIIEVMQGKIHFQSKKGVGTEITVRFPAAIGEEPQD